MPSSSKSTAKIGDPAFDPYIVLDIPHGASDAVITKAYRKLALQLHPDKQQNLSEKEHEKVAHEFHTLQEARAFLLDTEHAEARRAYDTKRASQRLRREQDAQRENTMSERRKRMRDELRQKEQATAAPQDGTTREDLLDKLRREGANLRQQHSDRTAEDEYRKISRKEKKAQALVEERQVRIKWSRSKIQISPSEHSLAQLLSQKFGPVESVEIIGSKGSSALITFENASSCRPCVDAYATSEEMRASFVGKRKQQYEEAMSRREEQLPSPRIQSNVNDEEGLKERKHRQAMERERMARQMEMEDAGYTVTETKEHATVKKRGRPFPLEFSDTDRKLTPLQTLESFEKAVFGNVLSPESMRRIQVTP
jgi:curved DNA-binding protein CbpA